LPKTVLYLKPAEKKNTSKKFARTILNLKTEKVGNSVPHERNVERDQFGSRTGLLGLHDQNRLSWRVRGTKRWAAGGGVRRSGPHELRWGKAVARALRDHPGGGAQIMRL
jgi:hypothetical protein